MRRRLFPIAQDRETACIGSRESICCNRAGRRGANGGYFAGVHDAYRLARSRVEQNHQALMRLATLRKILRIDADQFRSEGRAFAQGAGHDSKQVPLSQRNNGTQELARLTL